jgi:hypothetical protein
MKRMISALTFSGFAIFASAQTNSPSEIVTPVELTPTNSVAPSNAPAPPPAVPQQPVESGAVTTHDIRVVSGIKVDLGPIHDWEKNPTGDRPLKHWKKISFQSVGPLMAAQSTCRIKIEGAGEITAVVKNVPQPITTAYANAQKLSDERQKLTEQLTLASRNGLQTIQVAQTNAQYGIQDPAQAQQAAAVSSNLQNRQADLQRLEQSANEAANYFASISTEYAMFTGQKARDLEIWDCGIKLGGGALKTTAVQPR